MPTLKEQLLEGKLYSKTPYWGNTLAKAKSDVRAMLARTESPYLALSWGKQSIVMAHLVFSIEQKILCVHWTGPDAELIANFQKTSETFLSRWPLNYLELQRSEKLRDAIEEYKKRTHPDGVFIGLSAFESRARRITTRIADGNNIYRYSDGMLRCCPLAKWKLLELATYIAEYEIPLLNTYERFGLDVRTSTGCREGGRTEHAIDFMTRSNSEKMRKIWREKHEYETVENNI